MSVEYRVIRIGALSHNRLWGETAAVRTAHATTTVVCEDQRMILVDPSLPGPVLGARFNERTGGNLSDVTDVFCTTLRPVHRRGIEALDGAKWWSADSEIQWYREHLSAMLDAAERASPEDAAATRADLKLLERFEAAPEKFSRQVQVYPLSGATPGSAGLLLTPATTTIVIAGDAALTAEHVMRGQVWKGCTDTEAATTSLKEMLELVDVIIPGHDNLMFAPGKWV